MAERKIAVVLIHGIGEQRPLATLRSFVEAILTEGSPPGTRPAYWSKPDALSGSFELRRFNAPAGPSDGRSRPPTDYYEYYWAHKMEGNALSHSLQWLNQLLLRQPGGVPPALKKLWWLAWALLLALAAGIAVLWHYWTSAGVIGALLAGAVFAAKFGADFALRGWIGDAARYFDAAPHNVSVRDSIRRGGVELLDKLHASGDYRRIIVVGHSLGSAIALDVLYHYWVGARERHDAVDTPAGTAVKAFEAMLVAPAPASVAEVRAAQKAVWKELRDNGVPWRVSDFITLGSPLTHLPFLIDLDRATFDDRLVQRELPKCPPVLDGKGIAYFSAYQRADGARRSIATLHHAACFAATRWTNIYFAHDGWFRGDPVGGPLRDLFGAGIDDREVLTRHWRGRLNHVDYWRADPRDADDPRRPLAALKAALALDEGFGARSRRGP